MGHGLGRPKAAVVLTDVERTELVRLTKRGLMLELVSARGCPPAHRSPLIGIALPKSAAQMACGPAPPGPASRGRYSSDKRGFIVQAQTLTSRQSGWMPAREPNTSAGGRTVS